MTQGVHHTDVTPAPGDATPGQLDANRNALVAPVLAGVLAAALFAPVFQRLVTDSSARSLGGNDFVVHLDLARAFRPVAVPVPNPAFHALTWMLARAWGFTTSAGVLMVLAVGASAAALVVLARRGWGRRQPLGDVGAVLFALYVLLAEPPELLLRALGVLPAGTLAPTTHAWGSPTDTLMLPVLLVLLVMLLDVLDDLDGADLGPRHAFGLVAVVGVLMLSKPTFCLALIPGLPLHLLVTGRWRLRNARVLVGLVLVPILVILAWQIGFAASGGMAIEPAGVRWAPLEAVRLAGLLDVDPSFWVSHVALVVVAVVGGRRYFHDVGVSLAGCCWIVSLVPLLLLQETGPTSAHGNVSKPAGVAWFVLLLFTARFVALALRDAWQGRREVGSRPPRWLVPVSVFASLSLLAGASVYLDTVFPR